MEEIYQLEYNLLKNEYRNNIEFLEQVIHPNFIEYTSSGTIVNKQEVVDALSKEESLDYSILEYEIIPLSSTTFLMRYTVLNEHTQKQSLRSSIWINDDHWQLYFHQGTNKHIG